jgi:hypothetical protein
VIEVEGAVSLFTEVRYNVPVQKGGWHDLAGKKGGWGEGGGTFGGGECVQSGECETSDLTLIIINICREEPVT